MAATLSAIADLRERVSVREFERRLTRLSRKHQQLVREYLGTPADPRNVPESVWQEIERQHRAALMILLFGAAIPTLEVAFSRLQRTRGETLDQDDVRDELERLSRRRADWVSESVTNTTRNRLDRGFENGRDLDDVMREVFGDDRWTDIARNESVAAQSAGGSSVAEAARNVGIPVTEIWYLGKCDHCDTCPMLHGTSREFWGLWTQGPPLHPHCCCHIQVFFDEPDELIRRRLLVSHNPSFAIVDARMQKFGRARGGGSTTITRSLGEFFGFTKDVEPKDGDGDGLIYDGTEQERPADPSKKRRKSLESLIEESEKIGFMADPKDDDWLSEEYDASIVRWDELSSDEVSDLESHLESIRDDKMENFRPDLDDDKIAVDAGWSNRKVRDRLSGEFDEEIDNVVSEWYSGSESHGLAAIDEIRDRITDAGHDVPDRFEEIANSAVADINQIRDEQIETQREQFRSDIDVSDDEDQWLYDYWQENIRGRSSTVKPPSKTWYPTDDGSSLKFDTDAGEYEISADDSIHESGHRVVTVTFKDPQGDYSETGKAGGKAALQVFQNVSAAMLAYVGKMEEPKPLTFTAKTESRQRIYERLVRTIASVHTNYAAFSTDAGSDTKRYMVVPKDQRDMFLGVVSEKQRESLVEITKSADAGAAYMVELSPASQSEIEGWMNDASDWEAPTPGLPEKLASFFCLQKD